MAWLIRILMVFFVVGFLFAGWSLGGVVDGLVSSTPAVAATSDQIVEAGPSGSSLQSRVSEDLATINAHREARTGHGAAHVVYLEKVSFERSAGGVVARGSVSDFGAPRRLVAVLDAFDADHAYVASASSAFSTSAGSTPFSVMVPDRDVFESFSVRFLDVDMQEVAMRSSDAPSKAVPPLLVDDALHPVDLDEVAERLVMLGYADKVAPVEEGQVAAALIARFRSDRGLPAGKGVTVGDLLALRRVSGTTKSIADLTDY